MRITSAVLLFLASAAAADDEVLDLPHAPKDLCFKHFSGYVETPSNKSLFYWYVEAEAAPEEKPLLLWLNGGPGCSSLGGMFVENGPFVLDSNLNITLNPYSWNKVANVLYLEQPAGVGFSYGGDYKTNDAITSQDTYDGVLAFLEAHAELQGRDFFIAGESYGGHYVPNVAKRIVDGNKAGKARKVPLKGIAVGNGYADWQLDFNENVENGRYHALTSDDAIQRARAACGGDYARCFWPRDDVKCPAACDEAVQEATVNAQDGSIDIYDIYEDVCLDEGQERAPTQMFRLMEEQRKQRLAHSPAFRRAAASSVVGAAGDSEARRLGTTISPIFATCIDVYNVKYLNLPEVQRAIHVRPGTVNGGKWSDCGGVDYEFNYESELPNYREWVKSKPFDILIYNGDADYILSHMGNAAWITRGLNATVTTKWQKWRGSDRQVAGYYEEYDGLTFLTVKGAGHMVPKDRPQHALDMLSSFLSGKKYNAVTTVAKPFPGLCSAQ